MTVLRRRPFPFRAGADGLPGLRPARAVALLGVGHALWGAAAYRSELAAIAAHPVDAVGDGLFNRQHSHDGRAAAFWFMLAAPMVVLCGRLSEAALRAGDHRSATAAGRTVVGLGLLGTVVVPRSGFPAALPLGWLLLRGAADQRRRAVGERAGA